MSSVDSMERFEALKHLVDLLERSIVSDEASLAREWPGYRREVTSVPTIPVELHAIQSRLEAKRRYLRKFKGQLHGAMGERTQG